MVFESHGVFTSGMRGQSRAEDAQPSHLPSRPRCGVTSRAGSDRRPSRGLLGGGVCSLGSRVPPIGPWVESGGTRERKGLRGYCQRPPTE